MKIALVSAANSIHTRRWANALAERGHEVHVIYCSNHDFAFDCDEGKKIICKRLSFPAPFGYYLNAAQLKNYIMRQKFDIVNIHYASGYGTLGRLAGQKHALLSIWGSDVYDFPYQSKFNLKTVKKNLQYYDYLASTSQCMAEQTRKIVEIKKEIFITPFGVDVNRFKPVNVEKKSGYVVGTVKTLSYKYGIDISIKAFAEMLKMLNENGKNEIADNISYEIYGKGEEKDNLIALIQELGLKEKVRLMGYVENSRLPEIINGFDVFCCTSRYDSESFGVAVVEAMACAVPAVTSDVDGFREVMENGKTGYVVRRKDHIATAKALYRLITEKDERFLFGENGRKRVIDLYDWGNSVDKMESIYETMLKTE